MRCDCNNEKEEDKAYKTDFNNRPHFLNYLYNHIPKVDLLRVNFWFFGWLCDKTVLSLIFLLIKVRGLRDTTTTTIETYINLYFLFQIRGNYTETPLIYM